jgi:pyruvate phosphate dikinase-like enzyme/lamin tail-like protein
MRSRFVCLLALGVIGVACGDSGSGTPGADTGGSSGGGRGGAGSGSGGAGGAGEAASGGGGTLDPTLGELVFNEVMSQNEGAWVDEAGEADDWVELVNRTDRELSLDGYALRDEGAAPFALPALSLAPRQGVLIWVDSDPSQGERHAPFKLSAGGERLTLLDRAQRVVDQIDVPALDANEAFARFPDGDGALARCRYASPGHSNPAGCEPRVTPPLVDDVSFAPFAFPEVFPAPPAGVALSELALRPGAGSSPFIELVNLGNGPVALNGLQLRVSAHAPDLPWPSSVDGASVTLPAGVSLAPGERLAVAVPAGALTLLEADPAFEGVVTIFDAANAALDRVDFMQWPVGATLARDAQSLGSLRFCRNATRGVVNDCDALPSRDVGDRVRHFYTPGDFAALAVGAEQLGIQSVKFVVDLEAPGLVHLLGSARWPLHYTFVRERIYDEPVLDRCDPAQNAEFYDGWREFSDREYYTSTGRRFYLGTLQHYASSGLDTVEYAFGDAITGSQMRDAFYAAMPHVDAPRRFVLRAQSDEQVARVRAVEGQLPLVGPNAPFEHVSYQPLTEGVAYGTLRFVAAGELSTQPLGPRVIVVTDDVPNDIPLVGGLITEAFQTPLAHVNVLSQNRGTPNAGLSGARGVLAAYLDQLVRLEVAADGIHVTLAEPSEAAAFWASQEPAGEPIHPRLDTTVRGVQDLAIHSLASLPIIGAKAAQMAELLDVAAAQPSCLGATPFITPERPFAVPIVHYREHFAASGAEARLAELEAEPEFASDAQARATGLAEVRALIQAAPVDPELLASVEASIRARYGTARVRLRSSSNTEDLPNFNGAGLYTSTSAALDDPERPVADAMRTVWASLWNDRAYDERVYARIERDTLGMGILVHPAALSEHANGVGVSRNVLEPPRGDQFYINAQLGEASVTNPAPAISTEQLVYQWYRDPAILYQSASSLLGALPSAPAAVLGPTEVESIACALQAVHDHFRPLLDPAQANPWFAMEVEFKLVGPDRQPYIKQARPHSFGQPEIIRDCREL